MKRKETETIEMNMKKIKTTQNKALNMKTMEMKMEER